MEANFDPQENAGNMIRVESMNQRVEEISLQVAQEVDVLISLNLELAQKLKEVEQFYSNSNSKNPNALKGGSLMKDKVRDKFIGNISKNREQDAASREKAAARRMQDLMRQFGTVLHQLTQHANAEPFMQPVDVVIEKPMDFSTIKCKMEVKDGTGYKNVREMCADVRLIFKNAMKYNNEKNAVHIMAKGLLDKFEKEWIKLFPKVDQEERRRTEEEAEMQLDVQLEQEAAHAKMARDLSLDVDEVDTQLEDLRDLVLQQCRKTTTEEKKRLGSAITCLSPEGIDKVLEIIAQNDPTFQATGENVDVDMDAQSESTLWKLKFFVRHRLKSQMKSSMNAGGNNNGENNQNCSRQKKAKISRNRS